ncbi:hypothetical protein P8452_60172 [Trifolium repens]|nr:hypothetical protein P8452_60172 [Trifolium repens]
MAGGGKSEEVLDLIYEQNRGPGSRRNVRKDSDWSAAEDAAIIQGVDKYRRFGFSLKTTLEIIKKDRLYHDALTARTVQAACTRFNDLVGRGRTVALGSNAEVADLLLAAPAGDGYAPAADGDADTFVLGQLCEKFIDLASTRLARNSVRR